MLKKSLETIYDEYTALPKTSENVEKLYQLHLRLKNTRDEIVKLDSGKDIYDEKYKDLGLYIGPFSESLEYSNDLLVEIQSINPDSVHQEEAWFQSIYSGRQYGGPGDLETLKEYSKKYPSGKYTNRIYLDLGNYYFGLYKYLRYGRDSQNDRSSCYNQDSSRSLQEQLKEAQAKGIALYKKALELNHEGSMAYEIQLGLRNLTDGTNTESDAWCDMVD